MSAEEVMGECLDVMFGGLDTVASMMGLIMRFLATHPDFVVVPLARTFGFEPGDPGLTILPARHNTDGFFVASLRRSR